MTKETSNNLLQTYDLLQQERKESENDHANTMKELQEQLNQAHTDIAKADEKWTLRIDEQRQKLVTSTNANVDRCRTELGKQIRDTDTQQNEHVATLQNELKQQHTQHLYDIKATTKNKADV